MVKCQVEYREINSHWCQCFLGLCGEPRNPSVSLLLFAFIHSWYSPHYCDQCYFNDDLKISIMKMKEAK